MKKKSHSLSILLLKETINNNIDAIKNATNTDQYEFDFDGKKALLCFKQNPSHLPAWTRFFESRLGNQLNNLFNTGASAVFIAPKGNRIFAITFGYGKSLLLPDCYEENFGLRVVLNSVDANKLRSVDAQSLDAVPVHRRSQASVASNISDFGINIEQDLIYAATGQPKNVDFGKQITGKDVLKITTSATLDSLPELLEKLYAAFQSDHYKQNFSWIDNLREVRDPGVVSKLDTILSQKISQRDFTRTWLAIPDVIDWSDFGGFKYQKPKKGELLDDIDWPSYLESIDQSTEADTTTFRKQYVLRIAESSGQDVDHWSVYRCIYCEVEHDGRTFALNNGKWYRVDKDFLESINRVVDNIPVSELELPVYSDKSEGDYNERVYESDKDYFALMDKKMIRHGGGRSQIEFCDLYTLDKQFVHVKRYGGSSVLSHLFAQGLVSAQLFFSDEDFREKANAFLPGSHQMKDTISKPDANAFKLVYGIASNATNGKLELPLFSKINLKNCYSRLQLLQLHASICIIPVAQGEEGIR